MSRRRRSLLLLVLLGIVLWAAAVARLDLVLRTARLLPMVLGEHGPRTYLLLAQNSDELRATGGFISSVGTLTLEQGKVTNLEMIDSYAADDLRVQHPVPPEPLIHYMNIGVLLLRDANWWPDFPTSAASIAEMWQNDRGQKVDGVVALDLEGARLLLAGLGPLQIEGEAAPVDAANLLDMLYRRWGVVPQDVEEMGRWWMQRKDIIGVVAEAAAAKVQTDLGPAGALHLLHALTLAIDGRHLQVYDRDPAVQSILGELKMDGAVPDVAGDYLMVVDTNMGFNKVNPLIEQHIGYTVTLGARSQASLAVTYAHHSTVQLSQCVYGPAYGLLYQDMMDRCYWDYARVYAPAGSTAVLSAGAASVDVGREGDKQTFASYFVLAPGDSHTLNMDYLLPASTIQTSGGISRYSLLVRKQGGSLGYALDVSVRLPAGAHLLDVSLRPRSITGETLTFHAVLDHDVAIEVNYAH